MNDTRQQSDEAVVDPATSPLAGIVFIKELGVEYLDSGDGRARLALDLQPWHLNSWHVVHGGVLMSLLDVVMSLAGRTLAPEARAGVTVDMTTSFVQPGGSEGRLIALGTAYHRTRTMCFCDGEIRDPRDRLIAKATGTFKYLRRLD
jgi:uncharacterized protein (TIGR00369 family)